MPGIANLDQLKNLLRGHGVRTAYVKLLSPKQDNDKNQIYLGGGLDGVTNQFRRPLKYVPPVRAQQSAKSAVGKPKLEGAVSLTPTRLPLAESSPAPESLKP